MQMLSKSGISCGWIHGHIFIREDKKYILHQNLNINHDNGWLNVIFDSEER